MIKEKTGDGASCIRHRYRKCQVSWKNARARSNVKRNHSTWKARQIFMQEAWKSSRAEIRPSGFPFLLPRVGEAREEDGGEGRRAS